MDVANKLAYLSFLEAFPLGRSIQGRCRELTGNSLQCSEQFTVDCFEADTPVADSVFTITGSYYDAIPICNHKQEVIRLQKNRGLCLSKKIF